MKPDEEEEEADDQINEEMNDDDLVNDQLWAPEDISAEQEDITGNYTRESLEQLWWGPSYAVKLWYFFAKYMLLSFQKWLLGRL